MKAFALDIWVLPERDYGEDDIVAASGENFDAVAEKIIKKEFSTDRQPLIHELVGNFGNPAGKSAALAELLAANTSNHSGNKLGVALEVLQKYWHRFWSIEFPEIAGNPETAMNRSRWKMFNEDRDRAYRELIRPNGVSSVERLLDL
ncbi:MAG TPA: hypothetical protein VMV71_04415 [Candidatus Paceibacterota bacterium]|nr:hypothetical protein [Candidatus Paceibacterota bacterium]